MGPTTGERVVRSGTFTYAGTAICDVRIVQVEERPGSGDHEDAPYDRDDQSGTWYRLDYSSAGDRGIFKAGGGHHGSLEDAIHAAERSLQNLKWND